MIRRGGGYRRLAGFQLTTVIYDATVAFCDRFIDPSSRTVDQMVQAARSGRQNIAEGSRSGKTSAKTEIRLLKVARASLEELLLDYEDFLCQRGLPQWPKDGPEARKVCGVWRERGIGGCEAGADENWRRLDDEHIAWYRPWLESGQAEVRVNALICLINQAGYLLDRQLEVLERRFIEKGGYSESLARERLAFRAGGDRSDPSHPSDSSDLSPSSSLSPPLCPKCGKPMRRVVAKKGGNAGQAFWGCPGYPVCNGTRPI